MRPFRRFRDAITGRFRSADDADHNRSTTVAETVERTEPYDPGEQQDDGRT